MNMMTGIVLIVLIWGVVQIVRSRSGIITDERGNQSIAKPSDDPTDAELEELRERVKVLERIATDENSSEARKAQRIAQEIESLRGDIARRSASKTEELSE